MGLTSFDERIFTVYLAGRRNASNPTNNNRQLDCFASEGCLPGSRTRTSLRLIVVSHRHLTPDRGSPVLHHLAACTATPDAVH